MINFVKTTHKNLQDPTEPAKTYALAQVREVLTLTDFAKHISNHNSKYGKGDIMCVLTETVDCMREQLLNGNKVQLGDLGSFWLKLKSNGVAESVIDKDTKEKPVFSARNISGIEVVWYKGDAFASDTMLQQASFEEVQTRKATAEALKLKKQQLQEGTYKPGGNGGSGSGSGGSSTGGGSGNTDDSGTEHE